MKRKRVIIMGAAGRDFHNFNVFFRDNEEYEVCCFTATQIPDIEGRTYPPELAGKLYPDGIPIYPEEELADLIKKYEVDEVYFSYSDVSYEYVMSKGALVNQAGANFCFLSPAKTMLKSEKPVVAVGAVRTGCGKSQTSRKISKLLREEFGLKVAVVRHPMPYGDLRKQIVQEFRTYEDFVKHQCTIEEIEEYEGHINIGNVVFAGVDYEKILREAEKVADVVLWDGGNNDFPFYKPDLAITVVDPHRPGNELRYYPGEITLRLADVVIINKEETASFENIETVRKNVQKVNPSAILIDAASPVVCEEGDKIRGKRVLVVEDGPTVTHGEMKYGAGFVAATKYGAKEIVDPRPFAVGSIIKTFQKYSHLDKVLPAMGYSETQKKELEETINRADVDLVIVGTPIDLRKVINMNKEAVRVRYELSEIGSPDLKEILSNFVKEKGLK